MIFCNFTKDFQRHGSSSRCMADSIFLVNLFIGKQSFLDESLLLKSPPDWPGGNGVDGSMGGLPLSLSSPTTASTSSSKFSPTSKTDYHSIFLNPTSSLQKLSHKSYLGDVFSILLGTVQIHFLWGWIQLYSHSLTVRNLFHVPGLHLICKPWGNVTVWLSG